MLFRSDCDCYLLVNFRRERIGDNHYRGSLFSNQEFAIAYALGFEKLLIVNQHGIKQEGMLRYIGVNSRTFQDHNDCVAVVLGEIERAGWDASYSRRLFADGIRFSDRVLQYRGQTSPQVLYGWFLYLNIRNGRPDVAALEATARLAGFRGPGREFTPSAVRSPLKATGRPGFSHTIFPRSHEVFDALVVGYDLQSLGQVIDVHQPPKVLLNSAFDVHWSMPLPVSPGLCHFRFEIFAISFPLLVVNVELEVPEAWSEAAPPVARIESQTTAGDGANAP